MNTFVLKDPLSNSSSFSRTRLFLQVFDGYGEVSKIINKYAYTSSLITDDVGILYNMQAQLKHFWDMQNSLKLRNALSLQTINDNVELIIELYGKISRKTKIFTDLDNIISRITHLCKKINYIEKHGEVK